MTYFWLYGCRFAFYRDGYTNTHITILFHIRHSRRDSLFRSSPGLFCSPPPRHRHLPASLLSSRRCLAFSQASAHFGIKFITWLFIHIIFVILFRHVYISDRWVFELLLPPIIIYLLGHKPSSHATSAPFSRSANTFKVLTIFSFIFTSWISHKCRFHQELQ